MPMWNVMVVNVSIVILTGVAIHTTGSLWSILILFAMMSYEKE